jgi:serine/threonine protein phosphatase PrpC
MEDKTAIYENIELFDESSFLASENLKNTKNYSNALYAVFDGHCGIDCAQYVSSHLPLYIIQGLNMLRKNTTYKSLSNSDLKNSIRSLLIESFEVTNKRFILKASNEVKINYKLIKNILCLCFNFNSK